jgi:hypothetical protein
MKNGMRSRKIVLCCYVLLAGLTLLFGATSARAGAIIDFGPLPNTLPPDDESSAEVPIGFPVNFFGQTYTTLFVNNNGTVTFGASLRTFTPFGLAMTGNVFDPNLGNNRVIANTNPNSCKGQFVGRTAPISVTYEPTATDPAVKIIVAHVENIGTQPFEVVTIEALPEEPFVITGVLPALPFPINGNGGTGSFQVQDEVSLHEIGRYRPAFIKPP